MRILSIIGMYMEVFLSHAEGIALSLIGVLCLVFLLINLKKSSKVLWGVLFFAEVSSLVWGVLLLDRAFRNDSVLYLCMSGFFLAFFAIMLIVSLITFLFKSK